MTSPPIPVQPLLPLGARVAGGILSFLVPGLGQIYQGVVTANRARLWKGILFLISLWGMFFYGMYLSKWQNVYLPHLAERKPVNFAFWNLNWNLSPTQGNLYYRLHYLGQFWIGTASWPALIHYYRPESKLSQMLGDFQRMPPRGKTLEHAEEDLNTLQFAPEMGKQWDIAWVYTVIAGVLNILVIMDALAGPPRHPPVQATVAATTSEGRTA